MNEACTLIAEATHCPDVQVSFGVVLNESLGDSVKITVIATGFNRPEAVLAPRKPAPKPVEQPVTAATPEPAPESDFAPPPPPPPIMAPPVHDMGLEDDLDTPAYLRREKLLF